MKSRRRRPSRVLRWLRLLWNEYSLARGAFGALVALVCWATPASVRADFKFIKPLTIIYPFGIGGGGDAFGRVLADGLKERLGVPVLFINRPGANGKIGLTAGVNATADGYTIVLGSNVLVNGPFLYDFDFDPLKAFVPIGQFAEWSSVLIVNPSLPVSNVRELLELGKEKPNNIRFGYSGSQTFYTLGLMLERVPGAKFIIVPFKSESDAFTSMLGGDISSMMATTTFVADSIATGKVKAIGVTGANRATLLPDVAPMADSLPGLSTTSYFGFVAPAGTPKDAIDTLYREISAVVKSPAVRKTVSNLGFEIMDRNGDEFGKFLHEEQARFDKLNKTLNIKALLAQ